LGHTYLQNKGERPQLHNIYSPFIHKLVLICEHCVSTKSNLRKPIRHILDLHIISPLVDLSVPSANFGLSLIVNQQTSESAIGLNT